MDLDLTEQRVLVTGSTRGIGKGIAEAFLLEGAKVTLNGRSKGVLDAIVLEFLKPPIKKEQISSYVGDLCEPEPLLSLREQLELQGDLDHLVCNIGSGKSFGPLLEDENEWQKMFNINLFSAVRCVREMLDLLKKSAEKKKAATSITLIGSICGMEALGCPSAYAAAKAALISYMNTMAKALGKFNIRINVISPGNISFPGSTWETKFNQNPSVVNEMLQREVALSRFGSVEEISRVVVFLASKHAAFVTGAHWIVDGGQTRSV